MPFVNGQYTAPASSWNPAVPGTTIESAAYNSQLSDIETALSTCVLKDGTQTITANIPMSGFKFTGVNTNSGNTSRSEFVSGATYQDGSPIDAGLTAGSSTVYTATLTPAITAYADKQCFRVQFDEACGNAPTINFNSVGAKKIYKNVSGVAVQLSANDVPANFVAILRYDAALDSAAGGFWLLNGIIQDTLAGAVYPRGRLTLTTGVAVTTTDVTAATTVYYTPYEGGSFTQLSLPLDSNSGHTGYQQSGKNFDLFLYSDAGTLRLISGPAWSSDTARGTGAGTTELVFTAGLYYNAVSMVGRWGTGAGETVTAAAGSALFVGSMRMTADGQTEDSLLRRFVVNLYNTVPKPMRAIESAANWTYTTATYQPYNSNTATRLQVLMPLNQISLHVSALGMGGNTLNGTVGIGIGLDRTNNNDAGTLGGGTSSVGFSTLTADYDGFPGLGYHYFQMLEVSQATGSSTFYGVGGLSIIQAGIRAQVPC